MPENLMPPGPQLPVDSDLEAAETSSGAPRPVHLRWRYLGLVLIGGSLGTAARYLLSAVIPSWQGIPLGTFLINILGAFALGALLETLTRRGADEGHRRTLRLLIGTGVLGGFTTYSSLAVDADGLLATAQPWASLGYAVATLLVGAIASAAGIMVAAVGHGWRPNRHTFTRTRRVKS